MKKITDLNAIEVIAYGSDDSSAEKVLIKFVEGMKQKKYMGQILKEMGEEARQELDG